MKQMITPLKKQTRQKHLSRLYFLAKGCKQVPPKLTGGKILWAHPDGYFLNQYGQKIKHTYSPAHSTPGRHCHNGIRGNTYPTMRHFGGKDCHVLICVTFHGPRPTVNGIRYECDHINGDPTDYRACNLEWVTPAENRKRAKILRAMRKAGNDPRNLSPARLKTIFARFELMDGAAQMEYECTHHCEV